MEGREAGHEAAASGSLRSNLPAANLPEFAAAFACKPGQPMTRAETDQVHIWR